MGRDHVLLVFQYSSCLLAMSSQRYPQMAPLLAQGNKAHRIHVSLFYDFSPREEIIVCEFNCMGIRGSWDHPRCAALLECTELTIQLLSLLIWMKGSKAEWAKEKGTWGEVQGNWGRASKNPYWSHSGWNWVSSKELWQLMWCCPQGSLLTVSVNGF